MTTAIILLNWNGAQDTEECLASLYNATSDFYVVLVDNGSEDDSVSRLTVFLDTQGITFRHLTKGQALTSAPRLRECILYEAGENLGFARGNNAAVRLVRDFAPDRYLLLNNDTIVEPDFLKRLATFNQEHPEYDALTPLICYNEPRTMVWNAGGCQFLGLRKYNYAKANVGLIREKGFIPITFLTGCALFFSASVQNSDGVPLTERFFFGEEDFEFCLRQNRAGRKMACVLDSRIYHKVSSSTSGRSPLGRIFIHYLNRFIDMRLHYGGVRYAFWTLFYVPYVQVLLARKGYGLKSSFSLPWKVLCRSYRQDSVTREDFLKALQG